MSLNYLTLNEIGPGFWHILHKAALAIDSRGRISINNNLFKDIVKFVIGELPCSKCKEHSIKAFSYIRVGQSIFNRTVEIHNEINRLKSSSIISVDAARHIHSKARISGVYKLGVIYLINKARMSNMAIDKYLSDLYNL